MKAVLPPNQALLIGRCYLLVKGLQPANAGIKAPASVERKKKTDIMDVTYKSGINYLIGWGLVWGCRHTAVWRVSVKGNYSPWAELGERLIWLLLGMVQQKLHERVPSKAVGIPRLAFVARKKDQSGPSCICTKKSWLLSHLGYKSRESKVEKENFSLSNLTWVSQSLQSINGWGVGWKFVKYPPGGEVLKRYISITILGLDFPAKQSLK